MSLVFLSHFFLMIAMSRLADRRLPFLVSIPAALVSLYSVSLFVILPAGLYPPSFLLPCLTVTGLSVIPVLTVKSLLILNGLYLAVRSRKDKRMVTFLILLSLGQGADRIFFAFEPLRPLTLLLSMVLPYSAFLLVLPGILREKRPRESGVADLRLDTLCRTFGLTGEERDIVVAIAEGKSNKEIAFEKNTTMSVIKHKIYQLYKNAGSTAGGNFSPSCHGSLRSSTSGNRSKRPASRGEFFPDSKQRKNTVCTPHCCGKTGSATNTGSRITQFTHRLHPLNQCPGKKLYVMPEENTGGTGKNNRY